MKGSPSGEYPLVMSDTYSVERSTRIDKPAPSIYPHIADFHLWTAWSPWEHLDPNLQRTYSGAGAGSGAMYAWSGNRKAGAGNMRITEATEPSFLQLSLEFLKPFKSSSTTTFALNPDGESTTVTWTMTGNKTAITKLMSAFIKMDKMIGRDFEKGLEQLKRVVEADQA